MKRIFYTLIFLLITAGISAQTNFIWDTTQVNFDFQQDELWAKTEQYISDTWDPSLKVIQQADRERGIFVLKGVSVQHKTYEMNLYKWTFAYTVKFEIQDQQVRMVIDNAYCADAECAGTTWPLMPVSEDYPSSQGLNLTGVNQDQYTELMARLRDELQDKVDNYFAYLRGELLFQSRWRPEW